MTAFTRASLITLSYGGDVDACRALCGSVDRFVDPAIAHTIYVPRREIALFAPLANARRRIEAEEDLLPSWMWRVPMPSRAWRRRLWLPRRNVFLTPYTRPMRGWIAQQMMKIQAAAQAADEIVVHVDSDNAFIRPMGLAALTKPEGVRLYVNPKHETGGSHRLWHREAARLLRAPSDDFHAGDPIDGIVVWRRSLVRAMIARIEHVGGRDWRRILAGTRHFSEYVLYGVFVETCVGFAASGHVIEPFSLSFGLWRDRPADARAEDAFLDTLEPRHLVCLIQSTIAMDDAERRALFQRVEARAAALDRSSVAPASPA